MPNYGIIILYLKTTFREVFMEINTKFSLIIDKINKKISKLNIELSKDAENEILRLELNTLLHDRELLYKGDEAELTTLIKKYGELINE